MIHEHQVLSGHGGHHITYTTGVLSRRGRRPGGRGVHTPQRRGRPQAGAHPGWLAAPGCPTDPAGGTSAAHTLHWPPSLQHAERKIRAFQPSCCWRLRTAAPGDKYSWGGSRSDAPLSPDPGPHTCWPVSCDGKSRGSAGRHVPAPPKICASRIVWICLQSAQRRALPGASAPRPGINAWYSGGGVAPQLLGSTHKASNAHQCPSPLSTGKIYDAFGQPPPQSK